MTRRRSLFLVSSDSESDDKRTLQPVESISSRLPKWRQTSRSITETPSTSKPKAVLLRSSLDSFSSVLKSSSVHKTRAVLSDEEGEEENEAKSQVQEINMGKRRLTNLRATLPDSNNSKPRMMLRDSLQQMLGKSFAPANESSSSTSYSASPPSGSKMPITTSPAATSTSGPTLSSSCCSPSSSSDVEELSPPLSEFTSSSKKRNQASTQREDFHEALACIGALKAGKAESVSFSPKKELTIAPTTSTTTNAATTASGVKRGASLLDSVKQERKKYCSLNTAADNKFAKHDLFNFESSSSSSSSSKSDFNAASQKSSELRHETKELWVDKYAPTKEAELCVHAKKIKDIKAWLVDNFCAMHSSSRRAGQVLLLLDGPPGSAKASSVRAVANTLGLRIVSWTDEPDGVSFEQTKSLYDVGHEYSLPYEGRMKKFKQFFARSKRYPALSLKLEKLKIEQNPAADKIKEEMPSLSSNSSNSNKGTEGDPLMLRVHECAPASARKLILIQEFPFVAGRDEQQEQFREVMRDVLQSSQYLVVFVVSSHHEKNNDLLQIFGQDLMTHPKVAHISCNPVAATGIGKALDRVIEGEHLSVSDEIREQLVRSSNGDVRNAIHSLQFEALIGAVGKPAGKRKKARPKDTPVEGRTALGLRDVNYSIFHSLGKILHAKAGTDPESIVDNSEMTDASFTEYLHQNFLEYLPIDDFPRIQTMLEIFSDADVLSQAASQRFGNSLSAVPESYGSTLAVRGYMSLKTGAMQDREANWNKKTFLGHRGPLSSKVQRTSDNYRRAAQTLFVPSYDLEGEAIGPSFGCPSTDLFVDILPFLACVINPSSSASTSTSSLSSASIVSLSSNTSLSNLIRSPASMLPRTSHYSVTSQPDSSLRPTASLHQGHWAFLKHLCWEYGSKYQARDIAGIFTNSQSLSTNWALLKPPTGASQQTRTQAQSPNEVGEDIEEY